MPREPQSKYFWPASAITESDMLLLYRAREQSSVRTPITRLLARAVRATYGHLAVQDERQAAEMKEAA